MDEKPSRIGDHVTAQMVDCTPEPEVVVEQDEEPKQDDEIDDPINNG